jgi:hypothetical protein
MGGRSEASIACVGQSGERTDFWELIPEGECKATRGINLTYPRPGSVAGGKTPRSILKGRRWSREAKQVATVWGNNSEGQYNSARGRTLQPELVRLRASAQD